MSKMYITDRACQSSCSDILEWIVCLSHWLAKFVQATSAG